MTAGDSWRRTVDIGHWLQCCAFGVIGMITYSKRIGFLGFGEDVGDVMRNLGDYLAYSSVIGVYLWLHLILFGKHSEDPSVFTSYHLLSGCDPYHVSQGQKMPYLQAVLREALRVHPATGLPLGSVVPKDRLAINEVAFSEGARTNSWVEHGDKTIFSDSYPRKGGVEERYLDRPERWPHMDKEKISAMNRHWMPDFCAVAALPSCIGRHISMLEMCKLVPRLIRNFDLRSDIRDNQPANSPDQSAIWIQPIAGFHTRSAGSRHQRIGGAEVPSERRP
ncbi:uncharacterized protein B0H64DRAFT_369886 [Chaetomium fimeti]|uniref:Cytochrome P450 n=1 Tax=Chaetomium fimeti TaxID=1854472 RepID=A0AAE0LWW5_9PEZI|nr:hypothetical protein B0H64DRAFT_369886 [Chaetomium fimeti]